MYLYFSKLKSKILVLVTLRVHVCNSRICLFRKEYVFVRLTLKIFLFPLTLHCFTGVGWAEYFCFNFPNSIPIKLNNFVKSPTPAVLLS